MDSEFTPFLPKSLHLLKLPCSLASLPPHAPSTTLKYPSAHSMSSQIMVKSVECNAHKASASSVSREVSLSSNSQRDVVEIVFIILKY